MTEDVSPYLDYDGASERLNLLFNVILSPRTIENKAQRGEIPSTMICLSLS